MCKSFQPKLHAKADNQSAKVTRRRSIRLLLLPCRLLGIREGVWPGRDSRYSKGPGFHRLTPMSSIDEKIRFRGACVEKNQFFH